MEKKIMKNHVLLKMVDTSGLMQQDGCKTQDGRMTYKNVAQDQELCSVFFRHSAVLCLTAVLLRKLPIFSHALSVTNGR